MSTSYNGQANGRFINAHLFYKGKSVIVDYEHCLHCYRSIPEGTVPFEVYPYGYDIIVDYAKLDEHFNKVNLEDLINRLDKLLKDEQIYCRKLESIFPSLKNKD